MVVHKHGQGVEPGATLDNSSGTQDLKCIALLNHINTTFSTVVKKFSICVPEYFLVGLNYNNFSYSITNEGDTVCTAVKMEVELVGGYHWSFGRKIFN